MRRSVATHHGQDARAGVAYPDGQRTLIATCTRFEPANVTKLRQRPRHQRGAGLCTSTASRGVHQHANHVTIGEKMEEKIAEKIEEKRMMTW
jgi:hypothetical protein